MKIPEIWKKLLEAELNENNLSAVRITQNSSHITDPRPMVYDFRSMTHTYADDWEAEVRLCSGMHNYWMEIVLFHEGIEKAVTEPMDSFSPGPVVFDKFPQYTLELE